MDNRNCKICNKEFTPKSGSVITCGLQCSKEKSGSAVKDLGCSVEFLKKYLEDQFTKGMSWSNYGRIEGIRCWEIDHIKALANFDLTDLEQFLMAVNYKNLQPLWGMANREKGIN